MENIDSFVQVSREDLRYLALSNGQPYIPIGLNLCFVRFTQDTQTGLAQYEAWIKALAQNGGNFFRLYLSHPFFDIEPVTPGVYDASQAQRLEAVLAMARQYRMRVKVCMEQFRTLEVIPALFPGAAPFDKPIYHHDRGGPLTDMDEYFTSPAGRGLFLGKLDYYADRYASDPVIYGWELWNEINAVKGKGWLEWTASMLPELRRRFPHTLAVQTLGSYDSKSAAINYADLSKSVNLDIAQIHRYLDPGAELAVCQAPMASLSAGAIMDLRTLYPDKPVIISEVGAVEAHHAGPSHLYDKDPEGSLLHDMLFAPFFAGSAGSGQVWHWDFYVAKYQLWHHFDRFAQTVSGIDPASEGFEPFQAVQAGLDIYGLQGRKTLLLWCRDPQNNWQTELVQGVSPRCVHGLHLDLANRQVAAATAQVFDPWENVWTEVPVSAGSLDLPDFRRSLIIRIAKENPT